MRTRPVARYHVTVKNAACSSHVVLREFLFGRKGDIKRKSILECTPPRTHPSQCPCVCTHTKCGGQIYGYTESDVIITCSVLGWAPMYKHS